MKQGIGEWIFDIVIIPVALGLMGIAYYIRDLFSKKGL